MTDNPYAAPADPNADVDAPKQDARRHIKIRFHHIIYLVGMLFLLDEAAVRSHGNDNSPLLFACCFLVLLLHTYLLIASTSGQRWTIIGVSIAIGLSGLFLRIPYFLFVLTGLHVFAAGALVYPAWRRQQRHFMALLNSDAHPHPPPPTNQTTLQGLTAEIARDGESVELLNLLAIAHGKNKDFESAIRSLRRCLELLPANPVILANLAWYLSETCAFAESEEIFQSLIAKPQNKKLNLLVRANYSCMLAESGRVRESNELLTTVEQESVNAKRLDPAFRNFLHEIFQRVHAKLQENVNPADD